MSQQKAEEATTAADYTTTMETDVPAPRFVKACASSTWGFFKRNLLLFLLILSLVLGIGVGCIIRVTVDPPFDKRQQMYFRFPGDLLMRMLKCLIVPLIVSSLVSGLAGLDAKASGKMGLRAIVYYLSTTIIAVILGIAMVMSVRPGDRTKDVDDEGTADKGNIADSFLDLIRNMFPDNLVEACFRQTKTYQVPVDEIEQVNTTNGTVNETQIWYDFDIRKEDGMNVLGLVVFSVALGIVVSRMGEAGKPIYNLTFSLAEATMRLVVIVIWYSPVGIVFLIAAEIIHMEDPMKELEALALYMATVLAGLAIHGIIILPLLYFIIVRKNPYKYLYGVLQALLTAFGTDSSAATLPVTTRCLEENNCVDRRVTRFVLPVGATINMDGTALYEAVAALFIAQLRGIDLDAADVVAVSITATLASIGAASVPQAGLVTMVIVLTAIGLPADDVTKILAVDWLLDRFRTMVNVEGDSIGAGIIEHLSRNELSHGAYDTVALHDGEQSSGRGKMNGYASGDVNGDVNSDVTRNNQDYTADESVCTGF